MTEPLLLMTPGPTRVPDRVLRAGARPMIHHRTPEFSAELAAAIEMLGPVFGTRSAALPVHTTGRGATEAAICNFFSAGDEIIACCNGKFGEMWAGLAESYGLVVHRAATDWRLEVDASEIEQLVREHPRVRGITLTFGDTSTAVRNDIAAVCRAARSSDALVMVDGVSSIGGMPFAFDEWGVDVAVVASQKCLMSAPGLAFVAVSDRAWTANAGAKLPRGTWLARMWRATYWSSTRAVTARSCCRMRCIRSRRIGFRASPPHVTSNALRRPDIGSRRSLASSPWGRMAACRCASSTRNGQSPPASRWCCMTVMSASAARSS